MVTNGDLSFDAMAIPREELVLGYHLDDARLVMYPKKTLKNTLQQQQVFGPCGKSRVCCLKLGATGGIDSGLLTLLVRLH